MFRKRSSPSQAAEETVYQTQLHQETGAASFIENELPPNPAAAAPSAQASSAKRQRVQATQPANPAGGEVVGDGREGNEFYLTHRLLGFVGGGAIAHMVGVNSGIVAILGWLPNGVGIIALVLLVIGQKSRRWGVRNVGIELLIALMLIGLISGFSLSVRGIVKELVTPPTPSLEQSPS